MLLFYILSLKFKSKFVYQILTVKHNFYNVYVFVHGLHAILGHGTLVSTSICILESYLYIQRVYAADILYYI